jgi:hypothetical protein
LSRASTSAAPARCRAGGSGPAAGTISSAPRASCNARADTSRAPRLLNATVSGPLTSTRRSRRRPAPAPAWHSARRGRTPPAWLAPVSREAGSRQAPAAAQEAQPEKAGCTRSARAATARRRAADDVIHLQGIQQWRRQGTGRCPARERLAAREAGSGGAAPGAVLRTLWRRRAAFQSGSGRRAEVTEAHGGLKRQQQQARRKTRSRTRSA